MNISTQVPQTNREAELQLQPPNPKLGITPNQKILYLICLTTLLASLILNINLLEQSKWMNSYFRSMSTDVEDVEKLCLANQENLEKFYDRLKEIRATKMKMITKAIQRQTVFDVSKLAAKNQQQNKAILDSLSSLQNHLQEEAQKTKQNLTIESLKQKKQQIERQKQKVNEIKKQKLQHLESQRLEFQQKLRQKNLQYQLQALQNLKIKRDSQISFYNASHNRTLPYYKVFDENPAKLSFEPPFRMFRRNHLHYVFMKGAKNIVEFNCDNQCHESYKNDQLYKNVSFEFDLIEYDGLDKTKVQPDWIIVRNNEDKTKEHEIVYLVWRAAPIAKLGVTLVFKNFTELRNFNANYRHFVFNIMNASNWQYDETGSLNLRRLEGRIFLIFTRNVKKTAFPEKKPIKNFIAIQSVVKWIAYHMLIGIDKFFIYDNNGSLGEPKLSNVTSNRYGFKFDCMNLTEKQIIEQWDDLWEEYYEHIVYVPWHFLDNKGFIFYAQVEAQGDFINSYEDVTNYILFNDPDEMMFSVKNLSFPGTVTTFSLKYYTQIRFGQRKFTSRLCRPNQLQMQINEIFYVNTFGWAQKVLYQTLQFYPGLSIHSGKVLNGRILWSGSDWEFNHYNLVEGMISYSQGTWGSNETAISIDNSGPERYGKILRQICNGKCSQNFKVTCDMTYFRCPKINKVYPLPPRKSKPKK